MDGWIVVTNWDRFQHYKDREPLWIKLYTEINSRAEWLSLSWQARGLLTTIWAEYARARTHLRVKDVARLCNQPLRTQHIKALIDAGFIEITASKPASSGASNGASPRALAREVRSTSKKSASSRANAPAAASARREQLQAAARKFAHDWKGGTSDAFDAGLDELEQITGARLQAGDRYRLWEHVLTHQEQR